MFSLWQVSFHGFLQCSIFFPHTPLLVFLLLRQLQKHTFGSGEGSVKVKLYTASFRLVTCELMVFNLIFAIVTASLLIQLAVLSLLIYGYLLYRRLKFRQHGISCHTPFLCKLQRFSRLWFPRLFSQFSHTTSSHTH